MLAPLLGYFFCMITVLTAAAVLLTGFVNISPSTTTATEPRWVTPKNLGTAREVSFSGDPAYRRPAASCRPGPSIIHPARDDDALRAFRRRCSFVRAAQARQTGYSAGMIGMTVLE